MPSLTNTLEADSDPSLLQTQVTRQGSQIRIALTGEIDLCTAPRLTTVVDHIVSDGPVHDVTLDLRELTFCDVRGLTAFLDAHARIRNAGGQLTVTGVTGVVRRIATLARVNNVLDLA